MSATDTIPAYAVSRQRYDTLARELAGPGWGFYLCQRTIKGTYTSNPMLAIGWKARKGKRATAVRLFPKSPTGAFIDLAEDAPWRWGDWIQENLATESLAPVTYEEFMLMIQHGDSWSTGLDIGPDEGC